MIKDEGNKFDSYRWNNPKSFHFVSLIFKFKLFHPLRHFSRTSVFQGTDDIFKLRQNKYYITKVKKSFLLFFNVQIHFFCLLTLHLKISLIWWKIPRIPTLSIVVPQCIKCINVYHQKIRNFIDNLKYVKTFISTTYLELLRVNLKFCQYV